ncbi:hypothetical protein GTQ40_13790 [Flavobacteriaceae bacterium R38]|nr:hypothetical protein [Flavobacteriaceae bacterium R38]
MDNDIKNFFKEIRKLDDNIDIPAFEEINIKRNSPRKEYYALVGIAASFLIVFSLFFTDEKVQTETNDTDYVITLSDENTTNTESLILEESSIYSWEAPSESLINNFND